VKFSFIATVKNGKEAFLHNFRSVLCGLVVRILGYRSRGTGSVPDAVMFSER
jgi:hypothetical protein